MNKKLLLPKAALMVALSMLVGSSSYAFTAAQAKAVRKAVMSVPVPEMAAKAVELTLQAEKQDREVTAVTAVRAIVFQHKSTAPAVVATVSKAVPDVAAAVAACAAELSRTEASNIAQAASMAAPEQKQNISAAVNQSVALNQSVASSTAGTARLSVASAANEGVLIRGSGDAGGPSSGTVSTGVTPINGSTGGRGDGTFPTFPPINPGTPHPKDYTQPR